MPYISQEDRVKYIPLLDQLITELQTQHETMLCGHLNFCISYLLIRLFELNHRYVRVNTLVGALECAKQEFYRCQVAPYEDIKQTEKGKV